METDGPTGGKHLSGETAGGDEKRLRTDDGKEPPSGLAGSAGGSQADPKASDGTGSAGQHTTGTGQAAQSKAPAAKPAAKAAAASPK